MLLIILKGKNQPEIVRKIHENGALNLPVLRTEFSTFGAEF